MLWRYVGSVGRMMEKGRLRFFCEVCCERAEIRVVKLMEGKVVGLQVWCEEHKVASVVSELVEREE